MGIKASNSTEMMIFGVKPYPNDSIFWTRGIDRKPKPYYPVVIDDPYDINSQDSTKTGVAENG